MDNKTSHHTAGISRGRTTFCLSAAGEERTRALSLMGPRGPDTSSPALLPSGLSCSSLVWQGLLLALPSLALPPPHPRLGGFAPSQPHRVRVGASPQCWGISVEGGTAPTPEKCALAATTGGKGRRQSQGSVKGLLWPLVSVFAVPPTWLIPSCTVCF